MFRSILVAVDDSAVALKALQIAGELARAGDAKLTLVHAVSGQGDVLFEDPAIAARGEAEVQEAEAMIARLAGSVADLKPDTRLVEMPAARNILALAKEMGADLIVLGPHRRSFFHGSVGSSILDHATVSVLIAR